LTLACLESLRAEVGAFSDFQVFVVDNASGDGSVEKLGEAVRRENWDRWVQVVPSQRNGGFAAGNNIGLKEVFKYGDCFDYVVLLNPDTVARNGAVLALIQFMEENPLAGIAGSRLEDAQGVVECSAHTAHSPLGELESSARLGPLSRMLRRYVVSPPPRESQHRCEWVSGASLVVRRKVIEAIGGLDEGFFLYFEEVDFCTRARKAGWEVWFVPESRIVHLEGASTGVQAVNKRRPRYWYDSRRRYFVKHFGWVGLMVADILWAVGRASLVMRLAFKRGPHTRPPGPRFFAWDLLWGDFRSLFGGEVIRVKRRSAAS